MNNISAFVHNVQLYWYFRENQEYSTIMKEHLLNIKVTNEKNY